VLAVRTRRTTSSDDPRGEGKGPAIPTLGPLDRLPTIAVVGRPNVGKSTLFNRLLKTRKTITHDLPGVTRDRIASEAERPSGGSVILVDTGGFEPDSETLIPALVRGQALLAIEEASVVILLVDGAAGLNPDDAEIGRLLRRTGKPVILVVNKSDRRDAALGYGEFSALGFPLLCVSAEHGLGIGELWEELEKFLPPPLESTHVAPELAVAIIGRPNAGKSSLTNRLLGTERVMVSEVPGTTRDSVDSLVEVNGHTIRLVDTAGIRRRGRTDKGPEVLSVVMARRAIERSHVCLMLIDAGEGATAQDTHVAGHVTEAGRGVVVVVNKADLLPAQGPDARRKLHDDVLERFKFVKDTPIVFISALTGAGVDQVLPTAFEVGLAYRMRIGTGELNRVLREAWERKPPPGGKKPPRLYYATQLSGGPPSFVLFVSGVGKLHFSYIRYLENALRGTFHLAGVPIRFMIRGKREKNA
jgi:GTPase